MGKTSKWNDIFFAVIAMAHLLTRQWPMGGTIQTVVDVMLGISAALILFKYYLEYQHHGTVFGRSFGAAQVKQEIQPKKKRKRK